MECIPEIPSFQIETELTRSRSEIKPLFDGRYLSLFGSHPTHCSDHRVVCDHLALRLVGIEARQFDDAQVSTHRVSPGSVRVRSG